MEIDFTDDAAEKAVRFEQARARRLLASFHRWADANKPAVYWLWSRANDTLRANRRTSMKRLFEMLRYDSGITLRDLNGNVRLCNTYTPVVARILIKSNPDMGRVLVTKASSLDLLPQDEIPTFDRSGNITWPDAP